MEAKEVLQRCKQFFTELMAPAPAPPAPTPAAAMPAEYELKDGGKVMIDKLEEGGIVMIDGGPALPGDLELADGTKITVGDNGAITAITPAPAPADTPPAFDAQGKFAALETLATQKFTDYETKFAAYEQRFADYEVKMKKANKVIEELLNLSQLIVEAPAAAPDPATRRQNGFKDESKEGQYTPILFGE